MRVSLYKPHINHGEVYFRAQQTERILERLGCLVRVVAGKGWLSYLGAALRWPSLLLHSDVVVLYPHPLVGLFAQTASLCRRTVIIDHFVSYIRTEDVFGWLAPLAPVERLAYRRASLVLAHTETVASELREAWELPHEKVAAVYCVVDTERFSPRYEKETDQLRASLDLRGRFVVLYHGRQHPWHGLDILREAVRRLADSGEPVALVLLGRAGTGYAHERWVDSVPYLSLPPFIQLADVWCSGFVSTPRGDRSFGSTLIQALSMGRPVVTSPSPEKAKYLKDGFSVSYVPSGDPQALGEAIRSLIHSPCRLKAIGEAGRRVAIECFGEERLAERLHRICADDARPT